MRNAPATKLQYFIKNFNWLFVHMLVTTIFPFLIRSSMIWKWGMEYVGVSGLFASVLQVLNISELGMGNAILYSMYKPMAEHNVPRVNALLNLYRKIYRNLGIGIFFAGLAILPFLKLLIKGGYPSDINIFIVYFIQLLNTAGGYMISFYWCVILQADQKLGVSYKIGAIITSAMYIMQLVVIYNSHNYYYYAILLPIGTIILNIVKGVYVKRKYPYIRCEGKMESSFKADFYKRIFAMALSKIRTTIRNSIDSIVISAELGLVVLAQYQNYYQIMLIPIMLVSIVKGAAVPEFGVSIATGNRQDNYRFFELYSFVNNWISTWCTACLLCLGQNFMCLWVGKANMLPDYVIILLCIYFYIYSISDNAVMIRETTGVWWKGKEGAVIETLLNLSLNILLVRYWGVLGVLVATIVTLLCINLPVEYISIFKEYFQVDIKHYAGKQCIYFVNGILICGITYAICRRFPIGNFKALICEAIICILLPNVLFVSLNFYKKEFKQLTSIVYGVFNEEKVK